VLIEGLTNAPATFQSAMNSIFHSYLRKFVVVYLDNILIYSWTEEEHKAHVRLIFDVLKREKFYVCKAKSTFPGKELSFWDILSILKAFALTLKRSRLSKIGMCQRTFMRFVHFWAWLIIFVSSLVIIRKSPLL
jgi:hypothetical protein